MLTNRNGNRGRRADHQPNLLYLSIKSGLEPSERLYRNVTEGSIFDVQFVEHKSRQKASENSEGVPIQPHQRRPSPMKSVPKGKNINSCTTHINQLGQLGPVV